MNNNNQNQIDQLTTAPLSAAEGQSPVVHGDGLTIKAAKDMARELRAAGVFASIFPSKKVSGKRIVISWS